jgi:3-isopropylmalate dehydrogenase
VIIEGDDAGPEVVGPSVDVVDALGVEIEWLRPPVGQAAIEQGGAAFPDEARRAIDESDATLFGAASGMSSGAIAYLRWGKRTYANLRPARWLPGFRSPLAHPENVDFVIVRENLEDIYLFLEGDVSELAPLRRESPTARRPVHEMTPGRFAIKVITEEGSRRVIRAAFELARRRVGRGCPGKVTLSSKYNMLPQTDGLFLEVGREVAGSYPDIEFDHYIVDDFARRMVAMPDRLDVVVLPNLYGDILSDLAAGLIGGLGVAASGCYGDDYAYFESVHGSAPDIAGQGIINPTATMLSAAMMLRHLGEDAGAERLEAAIAAVYREGKTLTPDQGGAARTSEFAAAVARRIDRD